MFPSLHNERENFFLTESLASFQTMQPFNKDIASIILANQNRTDLAILQNILRQIIDLLGFDKFPPFRGHVNIRDFQSKLFW